MFDFVHERKRLVQIVLALIILPFAFWGVDSYQQSGNDGALATVEGSKISQPEFERELAQQRNRLRQMLGENFDASMFDNPEMRRAVLENLIAQRLLVVRARASGLVVTDEEMAAVIQGVEAFRENGKFDKQRYETALATQSMSPPMFEARLRDDMLGQKIREAYVQNGHASAFIAEKLIKLNEQQRSVSISFTPVQSFLGQVSISDADAEQYYGQNPKEFERGEQVRVEYVTLSIDGLANGIEVPEQEAKQYFDAHHEEFATPEQRRASHILITVDAAALQAEQDAAKAKAEQLLQQINQAPGKFAELAKRNSQDPGSAGNGGDLGSFGRGMMVKPFEDAVFSLREGEVSGLVKSDFGYHIIKLTGVEAAKPQAFEQVSGEIVGRLRQQKAADRFAELAEKFSNTVYEQSDTLQPAAELVGAGIVQSGWLEKGANAGAPWTPSMMQAVFAEDTLKNKRNTPATEVAPNTLIAARVLEHRPAAAQPLEEVREGIRRKLTHQRALELAREKGESLLAALRKGEKPAVKWEASQAISRAQHGSLDAELARQIFQADMRILPQYIGAPGGQSGYMLVRIDAVKEAGEIDAEKRAQYVQQLRQLTGGEMFRAYLTEAKQQAKIEVSMPEVPAQP